MRAGVQPASADLARGDDPAPRPILDGALRHTLQVGNLASGHHVGRAVARGRCHLTEARSGDGGDSANARRKRAGVGLAT
jgi:hypothetical protein